MAKLTTTFMAVIVLLVAAAVVSIPSAHGTRILETVEDVKLPVVVASAPTTEVTFVVPTAPGPYTVDYDDKTPLLGP